MAKSLQFMCEKCGAVFPKWVGQCDLCKEWNCISELIQRPNTASKREIPENFFINLDDFAAIPDNVASRHKTGINEVDRVLGGGLVDGSVILLGGAPGIGKSTLLLQLLSDIKSIRHYLYISAEESISQVMLRAQRLNISNNDIKIANTNSIEQIIESLKDIKNNSVVIIDSIQTISSDLIQSPPGSISQVRYCTQELVNFAKANNVIVIIIGHITKDGSIAGPKTLEHMVDCVLYFEGDSSYDYRILRVTKNRFGAIDEIGVFRMNSNGLEEVENPSMAFLGDYDSDEKVSGTAVYSGIEGSRPLLLEIQSLVSITNVAIPRRSSIGFDSNRLSMTVAILSNRCRLNFSNKDVYLNVAGGIRITEPAADLAVAAAIISAYFQKPLPEKAVFFGEVSLSGDVRPSHLVFSRIKESQKLGFKKIFCSNKTEPIDIQKETQLVKIKNIKDLVDIIRRQPD